MYNKLLPMRDSANERGSFLVEALVAFALVSTTLVIVVDSFLTMQRGYHTQIVQQEIVDSLAFALEDITRESRVSTAYGCGGSCAVLGMTRRAGLNGQTADAVVYSLSGGQIMKRIGSGAVLPLTPPSVRVTGLTVQAFTTPPERSRVIVMLVAEPTVGNTGVDPVYIQTAFTERR